MPPPTQCGGLLGGTVLTKGCETWVAVADHGKDAVPGIRISPDGNRLFVISAGTLGERDGPVTADIDAYDASSGALLWNATWRMGSTNAPRMLAVSPDSAHVYVVGSFTGLLTTQAYILAYDAANGHLEWTAVGPLQSAANAIASSPDGKTIYVTGLGPDNGIEQGNYLTLALDARTGTELWNASYDGHGTSNRRSLDEAYGIAVSHDGQSVYVTGRSDLAGGIFEHATTAYDATSGAPKWAARFHATDALTGSAKTTEGYTILLSADDERVYVLGTAGVFAYHADTGAPAWGGITTAATCRPLYPRYEASECALALDAEKGRLYALGFNDLAALDEEGNVLWHLPLHVGSNTGKHSKGMALSPDGTRIYLATPSGREWATDQVDGNYETLALDTTDGRPIWRVEYDRGEHRNYVYSIAIHSDGEHVYVTGTAIWPLEKPDDVVTVAYPTDLGLENTPDLTT